MSRPGLAEFVTAKREQLLEYKDGIDDAVVTVARRAQPVAVDLLALGDVEAAREWFVALVEEWLVDAEINTTPSAGASPSSRRNWGRGTRTSTSSTVRSSVVET